MPIEFYKSELAAIGFYKPRDDRGSVARGSERFIPKHAVSIRFILCPVSPTWRITNPTGPILFVLDYRDPWMSVSGSINPRTWSITSVTNLKRVRIRTCARKIRKKKGSYLIITKLTFFKRLRSNSTLFVSKSPRLTAIVPYSKFYTRNVKCICKYLARRKFVGAFAEENKRKELIVEALSFNASRRRPLNTTRYFERCSF